MFAESIWSSPAGLELLERTRQLAEEAQFDATAAALRANKKLSDSEPDLVRRAIEIVFTRRQAAYMGAWAEQGLFTRESIEQSSHPAVAARHAKRFQHCRHVLEIGTGAGIDTAALAKAAKQVTTIERKENVAQMARHNLDRQGIKNVAVIIGDASQLIPTLDLELFDGLWTDPARRDAGGNRAYNPEDWSPPLSFVLELAIHGPRGIKISPGTNLPALPDHITREWIGLKDECLEQTLWSGVEGTDGSVYLADADFEWVPPPLQLEQSDCFPITELEGKWLVEPHAALIRSGHLESFYAQHEMMVLDPHIAYAAARIAPQPHPLFKSFKVLDAFPFSLQLLNDKLAARRWNSRSEIKKRGFSETTDELRRKLKLLPAQDKQSSFGVVFVTRIGADHYAILAERAE